MHSDTLSKLDRASRHDFGAWYTPPVIATFQARAVKQWLAGYSSHTSADASHTFADALIIDPAAGDGIYPSALFTVADKLPALHVQEIRTEAAEACLAHIETLTATVTPKPAVTMTVGDTLSLPFPVLKDDLIPIVIGNPPYDRLSGTGDPQRPILTDSDGNDLFTPLTAAAKQEGIIFSAQASLYNSYVYFWRWALHLAFERNDSQPAAVSFITPSSWLTGPVFTGLRQMVSKECDRVWVIDLGGDGRSASHKEDGNVFGVLTPVAIVMATRDGDADTTRSTPAKVFFQRVSGTAKQKLQQLETSSALHLDSQEWISLDRPDGAPFAPSSGITQWLSFPALGDLLPWQQPGMKANRTWHISPDPDVLLTRWQRLLSSPSPTVRARRYVTPRTGRNIETKVGKLTPIAELPTNHPPRPITKTGWRSFDEQWIIADPRLIRTESPALWQVMDDSQVFMVALNNNTPGHGPAATFTRYVPDMAYFRGSYGGKDVTPLWRDRKTHEANVNHDVLATLAALYKEEVLGEDLFFYCAGILGHAGYTERFAEELATPGPRIPVTKNGDLFFTTSRLGRLVVAAELGTDSPKDWEENGLEAPQATCRPSWQQTPTTLPKDLSEVHYDPHTKCLHIADGILATINPEVWDFHVSGYQVIKRWIGYRTSRGIGRAAGPHASELDRIRPTSWRQEWNDDFVAVISRITAVLALEKPLCANLDEIMAQELIDRQDLPKVEPGATQPPKTEADLWLRSGAPAPSWLQSYSAEEKDD